MLKWDSTNNKWVEIPTNTVSKDSTHTYFESQIDVLSGSYVIRSVKDESTQVNLQGESTTNAIQIEKAESVGQVEKTENRSSDTYSKKAQGFDMATTIGIILIIYTTFMYIRKK
jgi:hypothetical protein